MIDYRNRLLPETISEKVKHRQVRFNNRYGIALAAALYTAKDIDKSEKNPAIVVGAPYGGV